MPSTDNLYNAFFFAPDTAAASPNPETTDNFDVGLRYRSPKVQAQLGGFFNRYTDRTASAFDPELNASTFRNLGTVDKYGIDGYVSYQPIKAAERLRVRFGAEVGDQGRPASSASAAATQVAAIRIPGLHRRRTTPIFASTAGKRESGAREIHVRRHRPRHARARRARHHRPSGPARASSSTPTSRSAPVRRQPGAGSTRSSSRRRRPAYWLVNLDARVSLDDFGLEKTYLQFNVYNLFDQFYVGGFGGGLNQTITAQRRRRDQAIYSAPPFVQIGAPRTISATLVVGF